MKKLLLATALVAVAAAPSAFAATGKITFKGELLDGTCAVTPGGPATIGNAVDMTVTLPNVQASALAGVASFAGTTPFQLTVGGTAGDSCNGKVTQLYFEDVAGSSMINADGFLDNSAAGTATRVGVRLLNPQNDLMVNLKTRANNPTATPQAGTPGVLGYKAQYFSKDGGATFGTVNTYVTYTVSY